MTQMRTQPEEAHHGLTPDGQGMATTQTTPHDHVVVMHLLNDTDRENALIALAQFGPAKWIDLDDDDQPSEIRVACPTQRGTQGAFRLHAIASALRVIVHCE